MTRTTQILPAETANTEITRFNALRHGVLSRYTVLPWESADEYRALSRRWWPSRPQGPTEEHLVEEMASILWRKRGFALLRRPRTGAGWRARWRPTAKR